MKYAIANEFGVFIGDKAERIIVAVDRRVHAEASIYHAREGYVYSMNLNTKQWGSGGGAHKDGPYFSSLDEAEEHFVRSAITQLRIEGESALASALWLEKNNRHGWSWVGRDDRERYLDCMRLIEALQEHLRVKNQTVLEF
ncbi:MAG: hypothetical protein K4305_08940 [Chlorobium sp.]|uniref:hypothetical protein n=1 Tax=Chlorobium sp. TaxID=1095 RepID=UPI002F41F7A9